MPLIKAHVKPELLIWARQSLGFTIAEAAKRLAITEERLEEWESGEDRPTINQLRKMTEVYKRPLAVFFLPKPPEGFQVMKDFRRMPGLVAGRYSPALLLEIRRAQERRQLALDLIRDIEEEPKKFTLKAELTDDADQLGIRIRKALGIVYERQIMWRDERLGFNEWRKAIEAFGVLVFQATRVDISEMRAFSLAESVLPVIVVNRKDYPSARTFSLMHEFLHLMIRRSGLCDINETDDRSPEEQTVEVFCNGVAAAALMPRNHMLSEGLVLKYGAASNTWTDEDISELAKQYSVSREALLRRLLTLGRTTEAFYKKKRAQLMAELETIKERQKEKLQPEEQEYRRNPPREALSDLGRSFVRLVMENYYQERLTLSEVSEHLGVRVRHVPKVQEFMGT